MQSYEIRWWLKNNIFTVVYLGCSLGLLLIIRSVFYNTALYTALFLTGIPPLIIGTIARRDRDVGKLVFYTWICCMAFYISILVLVVKFLYIMMIIGLLIAQDIAFKLVHYLKHTELFQIFEKQSLKDYIFYAIPVVTILYGSIHYYPADIVEQLNSTAVANVIINNFNIEHLWSMADAVNKYGLDSLSSLKENVLKVAGYSALVSFGIYGLKFSTLFDS